MGNVEGVEVLVLVTLIFDIDDAKKGERERGERWCAF